MAILAFLSLRGLLFILVVGALYLVGNLCSPGMTPPTAQQYIADDFSPAPMRFTLAQPPPMRTFYVSQQADPQSQIELVPSQVIFLSAPDDSGGPTAMRP